MILLDDVSFGYGKKAKLFDHLNLSLAPGHIYGLLGKNGAGKSSLLRNMAGLLYPQHGHLQVAGYDPVKREPELLQNLFFIPEEVYLPAITIKRYVATLAPFYPLFDTPQFYDCLKEFNVPDDSHLAALSFGQRKKVLISFGLSTHCQVLLMDEPTNGLDIPSKSQFRKLVTSALESDRLILISTHQVRDLDNLIDTVIVLDENQIVLHQPLEHISERLRFTTLSHTDTEAGVLYAEPSLQGYTVVMENHTQQESKVDLERLFNAVINNPARIQQLFETKEYA